MVDDGFVLFEGSFAERYPRCRGRDRDVGVLGDIFLSLSLSLTISRPFSSFVVSVPVLPALLATARAGDRR